MALTRLAVAFLALVLLALSGTAAPAAEGGGPLALPDTSSPQATMQSFAGAQRTFRRLIQADPFLKDSETDLNLEANLERATALFDMSQVAPDLVDDTGVLVTVLLSEILDRIRPPSLAEIPDVAEVEAKDLKRWRVPATQITLVRIAEGPRANEWLFDAETVRQLPRWEKRITHLPYRDDARIGRLSEIGGVRDYFTAFPGLDSIIPSAWTIGMPDVLKREIAFEPLWRWLAIIVVLGVGSVAVILTVRLSRWQRRRARGTVPWHRLIAPTGILAIVLLTEEAIDEHLGATSLLVARFESFLEWIAFGIGAWIILILAELVADWIIARPNIKPDSIDASLVRIVARIAGFVFALWPLIAGTERFGISVLPLFAGLGVGGLAIALAVRPTLENVIGGFILFADKPVRVGDLCRFGEQRGWVEAIGVRSTRIRTYDDTIVSIPNAEFSQLQLENVTRRRRTLLRTMLGLRYETTAEQLRYALAHMRDMLRDHPKVDPKDMRVRFRRFGDYSLDIEIFAYIKTNKWPEYYAVLEELNLHFMDIVKDAGTGFAFPSQTTYLSRDTGLDTARGDAVAATVAEWQDAGEAPVPAFDLGKRAPLQDAASPQAHRTTRDKAQAQPPGAGRRARQN